MKTGVRYKYDCKNCSLYCLPYWGCQCSYKPDPPVEIRQQVNLRLFRHGHGYLRGMPFQDGESLELLPVAYKVLAMKRLIEGG